MWGEDSKAGGSGFHMGSGWFEKGRVEAGLGFGCGNCEGPPLGHPAVLSLLLMSYDLRLALSLCACLVLCEMMSTRVLQRLVVRMHELRRELLAVVAPVRRQQSTLGVPSSHPVPHSLTLCLSLG